MGFFDFLFDKEKAQQRRLNKLRKTLTNMYVQAGERQYTIETLRELNSEDAVDVLLARFEETAPNHTTDAEEKERVYSVLVDLGRRGDADVVGTIKNYLKRVDENINWPLRVLSDLVSYDEMVGLVTELLEACKTDYQRSPEKKRELMLRATEFKNKELAKQVARFLEDANDTIRFLAVDALMAQEEEEIAREPLTELLRWEDSIRTMQKVAEIFSERQDWIIPEEDREETEQNLPQGYGLHKDGYIYQRRS